MGQQVNMLEFSRFLDYASQERDTFNEQDAAIVRAIETAQSLIQFYELHSHPAEAVDVTALLDKFDLRFLELPETTWGFTLDMQRKISIVVNSALSTELTRYVAMHEVGHIACWHPNELHNCQQGQSLNDPLETEATTLAAYVLLPLQAISNLTAPGLTGAERARQVAAHYLVPPELVLIRWALYQRTGL